MLALTKKASYGLVAMVHLAKLPGGKLACAREISESQGVPMPFLMNVLKELAAAGYVDSVRGAHGGYRLGRRPEEINLADLLATIERPLRQTECLTSQAADEHECSIEQMARCPIGDPVHRVHRRLIDFLRKVTLAEFVEPAMAAMK